MSSSEVSSSPLNETKPAAAGPTKVQGLARRYSALAKNANEGSYVPRNKVNSSELNKGMAAAMAINNVASTVPTTTTTTPPKRAPTTSTPLSQTPEIQERSDDEVSRSSSPAPIEPPKDVAESIEHVEDVAELTKQVEDADLAAEESKVEEAEVAKIELEVAPAAPEPEQELSQAPEEVAEETKPESADA